MSISNYDAQLKEMSDALKMASTLTNDAKLQSWFGKYQTFLNKKHVSITFGGHFNSGKSTLINALIERELLPADDLPETGAICILRSGEENLITLHKHDSQQNIEFSREAIRREVSLISLLGDLQSNVDQVRRLNITLKNGIIPAEVNWIDSPGINDIDKMTERAREAALYSDVLIWVLNSRQILSEIEMDFIANHVASRGPSSIIFALNVFLREDTPEEWQIFCMEKLPRIKNKIANFSNMLGLGSTDAVKTFPVSARAVVQFPRDGFGGRELWAELAQLQTIGHLRVVKARLHQILKGLREVAVNFDNQIEYLEKEISEWREQFQKRQSEIEKKRNSLASTVGNSYTAAQGFFARELRQQTEAIKQSIDGNPLRRDDFYTMQLQQAVENTQRRTLINLAGDFKARTELFSQNVFTDLDSVFREHLPPVKIMIEVPHAPVVPNYLIVVITILICMFIGLPIFVIGPLAGALVGGLISYWVVQAKAETETLLNEKRITKTIVDSETEKAVKYFSEQQNLIVPFVLSRYQTELPAANIDESRLTVLKQNQELIGNLISKAETLLKICS